MANQVSAITIPGDGAAKTAPRLPPTRQQIELRIGGMTCAHCPPAIEKALLAVAGVSAARVNPATKIARIDYDSSRTKIESILQAIRAVGYTVGTATTRIPIKNMHCSSCVIGVELALQMTPGIVSARANKRAARTHRGRRRNTAWTSSPNSCQPSSTLSRRTSVWRIAPPLTSSDAQIDEGLSILDQAIRECV